MKLRAIALDYDGTTAWHDRLEPAVREAIADARTRGITVLIVTGRSLDELRRVAGDLHFVDVVVAENGAVLHLPENDYTTVLAPASPPALIDELQRRGIEVARGQCLVDCATSDALRARFRRRPTTSTGSGSIGWSRKERRSDLGNYSE